MVALTPVALAFLELTFVMVAILLLHSIRRTIGSAAFYLSLGSFLVFGQLISSAGILIDPGVMAFQVSIGGAVLLAPYMAALLIVYVVDGTLEAQRLILGLLAILLAYFYLSYITASQCASAGYTAADPEAVAYVGTLFLKGRRFVAASYLAHAVDLFVLPILFQFFRNRNYRLFICVLGTFVLAQVIDTFVYQLVATPTVGDWWTALRTTYLARAVAMVWLAVLTSTYLRLCNLDPSDSRRPLDILIALLGSYGQAQELRRHVREWEGRYRVVVEHSHDLIFILDAEGRVLNANDAALRILEYDEPGLTGLLLPSIMRTPTDQPCQWTQVWEDLHPPPSVTASTLVQQEWAATTRTGKRVDLDVSISDAELNQQPVVLAIARDVTERRRLERERQQLQEQLMHAQRLEAIGQLAGGVAHDFNNLLHTVQGSLEALAKQRHIPDHQRALLLNIEVATGRASALTAQLLGFARRGKYSLERMDAADVLGRVRGLFEPLTHDRIDFRLIVAPVPMHIQGDSTQLEQVFLNMLLNARDAVQGREAPRIVMRAEPAAEHSPGWHLRPKPELTPDRFVCLRVKDNGVGIPEAVRPRIFEPFVTTKPVGKGTGMGLAMAYGCVANHNGWIHVESQEGKGTEFLVFLPRAD